MGKEPLRVIFDPKVATDADLERTSLLASRLRPER
jgi:hypothetical protein